MPRRDDDRYWQQFGEWMRAQREAQKPDRWTQQQLADQLSAHGHKVTRNWVNQVENGSKPGPDFVRAVDKLFGPIPAFAPAAGDQTALIVALQEQTAALTSLARELRQERATTRAWLRGWRAVLRAAAEGQVPAALLDALVPPPPEPFER